jgi:hypothetical protein
LARLAFKEAFFSTSSNVGVALPKPSGLPFADDTLYTDAARVEDALLPGL